MDHQPLIDIYSVLQNAAHKHSNQMATTTTTTTVPNTEYNPKLSSSSSSFIPDITSNNSSNSQSSFLQYDKPPNISNKIWDRLGDQVCCVEQSSSHYEVPSHVCYSLRLDIRNMGRVKRILKSMGLFSTGWNAKFGSIMVNVAKALAVEFNARFLYTQSDEITIIVQPPDSESKEEAEKQEEQQSQNIAQECKHEEKEESSSQNEFQHIFKGRVAKLISLSAAFASSTIQTELLKWWIELRCQNRKDEERLTDHSIPSNFPTVTFDCRLGVWDNVKDAFQLILWRAHDGHINGLSDAVYGLGQKKLTSENSSVKLQWLRDNGHLPLPRHQVYGTLLERKLVAKSAVNPQTGQSVDIMRKDFVDIVGDGSVLRSIERKQISL